MWANTSSFMRLGGKCVATMSLNESTRTYSTETPCLKSPFYRRQAPGSNGFKALSSLVHQLTVRATAARIKCFSGTWQEHSAGCDAICATPSSPRRWATSGDFALLRHKKGKGPAGHMGLNNGSFIKGNPETRKSWCRRASCSRRYCNNAGKPWRASSPHKLTGRGRAPRYASAAKYRSRTLSVPLQRDATAVVSHHR